MNHRRPILPAGRGFTLVELLATVVILSAIGVVASHIIFTGVDGYADAATSAQLISEESIAMDRMVRAIRRIQRDADASALAPDITNVTATSLAWKDSDGDAYSLSLAGGQLLFVDNGAAPVVLLDDVSEFSVQTYNQSNTALGATLSGSNCDPIRRVALQLTLQRQGRSQSLRTKVFIRSTISGAEGASS